MGNIFITKGLDPRLNLLHTFGCCVIYVIRFYVCLRRVDAFEYTQELDAFNMLDVSLYHGWLVDEEDHAVVSKHHTKR